MCGDSSSSSALTAHAAAGVERVGELLGLAPALIGDADAGHRRIDVELQLVEPVAGRLAHPADLLARRVEASTDAGSGAPFGRMRGASPTICASRAASVSVRRPPPPIRNGGCGCWTGFG